MPGSPAAMPLRHAAITTPRHPQPATAPRLAIDLVLDNFDNCDFRAFTKLRQSVADRPPRLGGVFPGNQDAPPVQPVAALGNNQQGPSDLHYEIARIDLHKGGCQPARGGCPHHDDIAGAGLPDDKACREILAATPLDFHSTVLYRGAKLAFSSFSRFLIAAHLIDQPLGRFAFREIEGRTRRRQLRSPEHRTVPPVARQLPIASFPPNAGLLHLPSRWPAGNSEADQGTGDFLDRRYNVVARGRRRCRVDSG